MTVPPDTTEVGLADFWTVTDGATSVMVTVASSSSQSSVPSSSSAETMATLVWVEPALPVTSLDEVERARNARRCRRTCADLAVHVAGEGAVDAVLEGGDRDRLADVVRDE